jgi:hypothetical protein
MKKARGSSDALVASIEEACDRYALHRELRALSAGLYRALTPSDKRFLADWQSCEYCGDNHALAVPHWERVFAKKSTPVLPRAMVFYRAVSGEHAAEVSRRKSVALDRFSSFAHSPQMARDFALWQLPNAPVTIMCVTVQRGTPFVFASGRDTGGGFSARGRDNIDKTQGEVVFAPMTLTKQAPNRKVRLCDGVVTDRLAADGVVTVVTCAAGP